MLGRSSEKFYPPRWHRILGLGLMRAGDEVPESGDDQRCGDHYIEDGLECHKGGGEAPPGEPSRDRSWHDFQPDEANIQSYRQKVARRAPGQGAPVSLSSNDLVIALTQGKYALLSAGRNPSNAADMQLTDQQIEARSQALHQDLVDSGYMFTPSLGRYGGESEDSFLVMAHEAEPQEIIALGQKYNQDSVIVADKGQQQMIFTTGENAGKAHSGSGFQPLPEEAPEYTKIDTEEGRSVKFSLNFDWDRLHRAIARALRYVLV